MTIKWSEIPACERRRMSHRFSEALTADLLVDPEYPPAERPVRFDELYRMATEPAQRIDARLAETIAADPKHRAVFETLLRQSALCWFPAAAAAADSDGLDMREEDGFRIQLRASRARGGQIHVLIRPREGGERAPVALVAIPPGEPPLRRMLPEEIDGVFALLEEADSPLVHAIRNPAAKLALQ